MIIYLVSKHSVLFLESFPKKFEVWFLNSLPKTWRICNMLPPALGRILKTFWGIQETNFEGELFYMANKKSNHLPISFELIWKFYICPQFFIWLYFVLFVNIRILQKKILFSSHVFLVIRIWSGGVFSNLLYVFVSLNYFAQIQFL